MALFGLFRSPKKDAQKPAPEMTGGVVNTGVDVYSFHGTPEEYFTYILNRNFYGYEIRRNVAFADIYDPQAQSAPPPGIPLLSSEPSSTKPSPWICSTIAAPG